MAGRQGQTGADPGFCTNLRTKGYFLTDASPATHLAEDRPTTGYWCLRTMGPIGPDDGYASAQACGSHRSCHESLAGRRV
jgi:hypothetical protein